MSKALSIARSGSAIGAPTKSAQRVGGALLLIYLWWFLVYFDLHRMLGHYLGGESVVGRIPIVLLIPILVVLIQRGSTGAIYWPMILFTAIHFVGIFVSENRGLAFTGFKTITFYLIAFTATAAVVRTPQQALILCKMFLLSFLWYFMQGLPHGSVRWHHVLGNTDAFGPLGAMGMAFGYFFGIGTKSKKWRYISMGIAMLGAVAVIASFARGAFVAAVAISAFIWLRSPRKIAILGCGAAGAILIFIAAELTSTEKSFWGEMATISEGTSSGTGANRWIHWTQVAWPVFLESPIVGVGSHCTGVVAARIIPPNELSGSFAKPSRLYGRPLHNVYVQILTEEGVVGFVIWIGMLVDFFRRLRTLRTKTARAIWSRAVGGQTDLLYLALALEAAMIGFLVGAVFYNQTYRHWFFTLILLALILSEMTRRLASTPQMQAATRSVSQTLGSTP